MPADCSTKTCKYLHNVIHTSARLQFAIDLAFHNLLPNDVDPAGPYESYASRRARLSAQELSWSALRWIGKDTINCTPALLYDFAGGIYASGVDAREDRRYSESVVFYRLPTASVPEPHTWRQDLQMIVLDFNIDPSQDLILLLTLAPRNSTYVQVLIWVPL
jgi:hypothetical protein